MCSLVRTLVCPRNLLITAFLGPTPSFLPVSSLVLSPLFLKLFKLRETTIV